MQQNVVIFLGCFLCITIKCAIGCDEEPKIELLNKNPYQVAIEQYVEKRWIHTCSGVIIDKYYVLTSAQCAKSWSKYYRVVAGHWSINKEECNQLQKIQVIPVLNITVHECYTPPKDCQRISGTLPTNDIALVRLCHPLVFNDLVSRLPLPKQDQCTEEYDYSISPQNPVNCGNGCKRKDCKCQKPCQKPCATKQPCTSTCKSSCTTPSPCTTQSCTTPSRCTTTSPCKTTPSCTTQSCTTPSKCTSTTPCTTTTTPCTTTTTPCTPTTQSSCMTSNPCKNTGCANPFQRSLCSSANCKTCPPHYASDCCKNGPPHCKHKPCRSTAPSMPEQCYSMPVDEPPCYTKRCLEAMRRFWNRFSNRVCGSRIFGYFRGDKCDHSNLLTILNTWNNQYRHIAINDDVILNQNICNYMLDKIVGIENHPRPNDNFLCAIGQMNMQAAKIYQKFGAPLLDPQNCFLAGILSWVPDPCGIFSGGPALYTKVSKYVDWIHKHAIDATYTSESC